MFTKKLATALVAAATVSTLLAAPGAARADEPGDQDPFMLFKMSILDRNKDGMVSKTEFMAMVEKAYDMKVKESGARGVISEAQMQALLKSLYYIGGN